MVLGPSEVGLVENKRLPEIWNRSGSGSRNRNRIPWVPEVRDGMEYLFDKRELFWSVSFTMRLEKKLRMQPITRDIVTRDISILNLLLRVAFWIDGIRTD